MCTIFETWYLWLPEALEETSKGHRRKMYSPWYKTVWVDRHLSLKTALRAVKDGCTFVCFSFRASAVLNIRPQKTEKRGENTTTKERKANSCRRKLVLGIQTQTWSRRRPGQSSHICPILSGEPLNIRQKADCFTGFQLWTNLSGTNQQAWGWEEVRSCLHVQLQTFLSSFPARQLADRTWKIKWIKQSCKQLSSESRAHIFMILSVSCCYTDHMETSIRTFLHRNCRDLISLSGLSDENPTQRKGMNKAAKYLKQIRF